MFINSMTKLHSEIRVVDRKHKNSWSETENIITLFPRSRMARAFASHSGETFYLLSDCDGVYDFKVMTLEDSKLNSNNLQQEFKNFYTPKDGEIISEMDLFQDHLGLYYKR